MSGKIYCTLFLAGIGLGALAAATQAATAVGVSPAQIRSSLAPDMPMTQMGHGEMSAEREIDIGEISNAAKVWIRTPLLIQTSHTHLFGQTLISGLLGLIFLFSALPDGRKGLILALPFAGTFLDIGGMWLTRFASPALAFLVFAGGALFAAGYCLIAAISVYELWFRKETIR
ncbi:MAG TPA: hypothetical protein VKH43_02175 [Thermoanaerobaculia bacterium]|nr:hypothetical protein [Thermoanaerobaculia bacterium]